MRRLSLGVIGHVDHGKTALVRALTGIETDRLPEEQARGISIALGFAFLRVAGGEADLIDMPGHERFVRTMVSGATGIDAVLLVADAREGVMPQTREHVDIAALLGIRRAILAISRSDLADAPATRRTGQAAAALLAEAGLHAAPPIACSARSGEGLPAIREAIEAELAAAAPRADDGFCWLPIDRVFSRPGHGTVVTGTLRRGRLATGDPVEIVPGGIAARVRGLQVHGERVTEARPGQRVAVNLRGVEAASLGRGAALATPGALPSAHWMSVDLQSVGGAPPLPTGRRLRLLFGTEETDARVRLLDRDVLQPGETALAQLHCRAPVCLPAREQFILRSASPALTVGGGLVLDPQAARERRHAPAVLARLSGLRDGDPASIAATELERAGIAGVPLARIARTTGVSPPLAAALLADSGAVLTRGGEAASARAVEALATILPKMLAAYPEGLARESLGAQIPRAGRAVLDEAIGRLLASGTLARDGAAIRLHRPDQDRLARQQADALAARLAAALLAAGLSPPDAAEIAPDVARRRLLDRLVREGVVVRAPDHVQKREILFHRDAIDAARRRLAALLPAEGLPTGEIGAALGISRKFSVPLLEYLDSVQFTRRIAERRVLASPPKTSEF